MGAMIRLRLLGPACVEQIQSSQHVNEGAGETNPVDDVPRFRSKRTIALLGYLAAEQRPLPRSSIASLFWPDKSTSQGLASLRRELHNLTSILPHCWEFDRKAIAFTPSNCTQVDLYDIRKLEKQERWIEAAELLAGEFLEGIHLEENSEFDLWLMAEREYWRAQSERILGRTIEWHTRRGRYTDALEHARHLVKLAPSNERAHRHVMRLLTWTGQRGAALQHFDICCALVREDLETDPTDETIALNQKIRAGQLDLPPQVPAFLTEEKPKHKFERRLFLGQERELAKLHSMLSTVLGGAGQVGFVTGGPGRGKTALLEEFSQQAMEHHPELLVARGRCTAFTGKGDPFLPLRDVMEMLAGDVEQIWDAGSISRNHAERLWTALPLFAQILMDQGSYLIDTLVSGPGLLSRAEVADSAEAPWLSHLREIINRQSPNSTLVEQTFIFQQVTNVMLNFAEEQPLLLLLDDLQWADTATISLLFHLCRALDETGSSLFILCAYRPEEVSLERQLHDTGSRERHPLVKAVSEFIRSYGDVSISLSHPDLSASRQFIDGLLDQEPNRLSETFRDHLLHRTEGHPLFTIELLSAMKEIGHLQRDEEGFWIEDENLNWNLIPARVEAVIKERIDRLDPKLREILRVASVEGEQFSAQIVSEVLQRDERSVLASLSQDLEQQHRLVREQEETYTGERWLTRFRFSHALYQEYVQDQLSQGELRILHGHVAKTMEGFYAIRLDEIAMQLAHHFQAADETTHAIEYYTIAAERAARLYASDEALAHYSHAIDLAQTISPDTHSLADLHRGRGQVYERIGDFKRALIDYQTALEIARASLAPHLEWRGLIELGRLWAFRDYSKTRACFDDALSLARKLDDPETLACSLNWMGNWHTNAESPTKAITLHLEALKITKRLETKAERANSLDLLGVAHLMQGDLTSSIQFYDQAIALFRELNDLPRLVSSLTGRAANISVLAFLSSAPADQPPDALSDVHEALQIANKIGARAGEAWAFWCLGMLYLVNGDFGRAKKNLQTGLKISSEMKHHEYEAANLFGLGILHLQTRMPEKACEHLERALLLAQKLSSPAMTHTTSGSLAGAYLMLNNPNMARAQLGSVIANETPMDTWGKRYCWIRRAELAFAQGDPHSTLEIANRLIASMPGSSHDRVVTYLWKLEAEALLEIGASEEALILLQTALQNALASEEKFLLWQVHASLARAQKHLNNQIEYEREISMAREEIKELAGKLPEGIGKNAFIQRANDWLDTNNSNMHP